MSEKQRKKKASRAEIRRAARLGAVQALYQMEQELGYDDPEGVILDFHDLHAGAMIEMEPEDTYLEMDRDMFADVVRGVARRRKQIDDVLGQALPEKWPVQRLESLLLSVMRAGVYELIMRQDVPYRVVINEYVEVAHGFFEGDEPSMLNAVLDATARQVRANEVAGS